MSETKPALTWEDYRLLEDAAVAFRILADRAKEPSDAAVYRDDERRIDDLRARIVAFLPPRVP